jgi:hypothetical protein
MFGFSVGNAATRLLAWVIAALVVLVAAGLFLRVFLRGPTIEAALDFEECVEALPAEAPSVLPLREGQRSPMTECNARFAGRRKPGGGYSYYDFMQDRSFDIAGPNPTPDERNRIDREYIGYLDLQRRETVSGELAKRQDEQRRADVERAHQPVGRPLVLTPRNPVAQASKRPSERTKPAHCEESALACGWMKLSTVVKDAFASSRASP